MNAEKACKTITKEKVLKSEEGEDISLAIRRNKKHVCVLEFVT